MKKIIILITLVFFLTGCYDNIELNNLAIITGLGIDYIDNEFYLTYEILNDTKTENNTTMLSYTVEGHGQTLADAFVNTNYKVGKKPYFAHLRVCLLSEAIINGEIDKIIDYLIRDINIRDEFIPIVTNGVSPNTILKHNDDNNPVVSDLIMNLINNEKFNNNLAIDDVYQKVLAKFISKNCDVVLSSISLLNNEIALNNFYIFKGYNYQNTLTKDESMIYNLIENSIYSAIFIKEYDGKTLAINISHSASDINVSHDLIELNIKLEGKIVENNPNFDLKDEKTYQKLDNDFSELIKKQIIEFIKKLQENESDILGLQEIYYKKYRKENKGLWKTAQIKVNNDLKINTKGFIFEVIQ